MKTTIQSLHFDADIKLLQFIESKLNHLDQYLVNIHPNSTEVILKIEHSGSIKEKVVELLVSLPGLPITIKATGKKFEEAFRKAYIQLKRIILKYKERFVSMH